MAREEIFFGVNIDTGQSIKTFGELKNRTKTLKKELDGLKVGSKRFNEIKKEITANQGTIRRFNRELRQTKSLATRVGQGVTNAFKGIGGALAGAFAARSVFNFFKNASKIVADFEQQMAKVRAVTGATNKEFEKLSKSAKELGSSTKFTATEVGQLQEEFAKLGFSTNEILSATEATLQLATATQADLAQAATVAASTVRGFGLDASETQRVVDVMAKSFSSSALDINKFQTAMAIVAPVSKNAGASIEQTTAILGRIMDAGVDASTAGTALRNIFLELAKSGLTWEEAMKQIQDSTNKNATAMELFGKRGATVANIIAQNSANIAVFKEELDGAAGSASAMADIVGDTLEGDVDRLSSAWEGLILSFQEGNNVVRDAIQGLTGLVSTVSELRENAEELEATGFEKVREIFGLSGPFGSLSQEAEAAKDEILFLRDFTKENIKLTTESNEALENKLSILESLISAREISLNQLRAGDFDEDFGENVNAVIIANERALNSLKETVKQLNVEEAERIANIEKERIAQEAEIEAAKAAEQQKVDDFEKSRGRRQDIIIDTRTQEMAINTELNSAEQMQEAAHVKKMADIAIKEAERKQKEEDRIAQETKDRERALANARLEAQSNLLQGTLGILSRDEEARKKNAKIIKAIAIADVIVNTQKALMNVDTSSSSPLFLGNLLTGGVAGLTLAVAQKAGILVQSAASIAAISSQKFAKGGILQGRSHSQGGIKTPYGELEGGEAVINKKSTSMFGPVLSAINEAGGGRKFERGGVLGVPSTNPTTGNSAQAQLVGLFKNFNLQPKVSVIEINEAQTRISEINNNSIL